MSRASRSPLLWPEQLKSRDWSQLSPELAPSAAESPSDFPSSSFPSTQFGLSDRPPVPSRVPPALAPISPSPLSARWFLSAFGIAAAQRPPVCRPALS